MDFSHTQERRMLQDSLRRFLAARYTTRARNAIGRDPRGFSDEIWAGLAELGVVGALFEEAVGGFGGGGFDILVVFEEIGRAGAVDPLVETAIMGGGLVADLGTDEQKVMVAQIVAGTRQLAFAGLEPGGRYDLDHVETRAVRDGDGFVLTGRKAVVTNAPAADLLLASAREGEGTDGIRLFLVEPGAAGLTMRDYGLVGGGRAAEITLEKTPAILLGDGTKAYEAIERRAAHAIVALCAEAVGLMETATGLTNDYLKTRKQFGQPIGKFQALQHRMADMAIALEQARSAAINAAGNLHRARAIRERHMAAAKNLIGRAARHIAEEAIQLHGGIAMTQEYELAHIAKRLVMIDHRFGDADHHLARFVALSRESAA
ncbi:acyl-CoA dehydrogenase family protein [Salinarimonas sp.]|uniref:acyl-CoA dehydrogenase family protein n=1 Tax=Salinarimonas sp. TaxID=2766526 RepID=UPI00391CC7B9